MKLYRIVMKNYFCQIFVLLRLGGFLGWKLPDAQMNGLSDVLHRKKEIHDE